MEVRRTLRGSVGTHWHAGLMRWKPHTDEHGRTYPLHHLHPFRFELLMPARNGLPETNVMIYVGFGLHCFTRHTMPGDRRGDSYGDDREIRTFDCKRYELSKRLRAIVKELPKRPCAFAKNNNYVTIDIGNADEAPQRYGIFFNVKRWAARGPNAVLVVVQSAYALDSAKQTPGRGRIRFQVLVGHALRGTKPRPPR